MAGLWIQNGHGQMMPQQMDKAYFDSSLMNSMAGFEDCQNFMVHSNSLSNSEGGMDSVGMRHLLTDDSDDMNERKQMDSESRAIFRKQFRKTQLCRFYKGSGCHMGPECEFAHGREELQKAPDLRRTSICPRWMQGNCPMSAENCSFAHGASYLRRTIGFQTKAPENSKKDESKKAKGQAFQKQDSPLIFGGLPKREDSDMIQVEVQRQQNATMQLHTLIQEQQLEIEQLKNQLNLQAHVQACAPTANSQLPLGKYSQMYIGHEIPKLPNVWQHMQLAVQTQADGDLVLRL